MPYTKSDVPSYVPKSKAAQWAEVWNSAYAKAKKDGKSDKDAEASAFAQANGVTKEDKAMATKKEVRTLAVGELRAIGGSGDSDPLAIEGYAAKFGTWSQDLGGYKETIKPGTFKRAIDEGQDVRCLMNHDPNFVLGRTKSGTLKLKEDNVGLFYRCELPNTQVARDLHTSIARGDISQCSFSFAVQQDKWNEEQAEAKGPYVVTRELHDVDLFDCSPVTYPAYLDTEVNARAAAIPVEVRSLVDRKNAEMREASLEHFITAVGAALKQKFGVTPGGCDWPTYWPIETFTDHVIACKSGDGTYWNIAISVAPGTDADVDDITVGDMVEVEQTWVPSTERGVKNLAEYRAARKAKIDPDNDGDDDSELLSCLHGIAPVVNAAVKAAQEASKDLNQDALLAFVTAAKAAQDKLDDAIFEATDELSEDSRAKLPGAETRSPDPAASKPHTEGASHVPGARDGYDDTDEDPDYEGEFDSAEPGAYSAAHTDDGNCDDPNCACQNRWNMVPGETTRAAVPGVPGATEVRDGDGKKVKTKRVGGKDLTKSAFAYVGDATKTETWKLPIHDEAHVRNALARFSSTDLPADAKAGVYRKIVAAAKKFGIKVSDEESNSMRATFAPDEQEKLLMLARLNESATRN